jgi:hypothetical protein
MPKWNSCTSSCNITGNGDTGPTGPAGPVRLQGNVATVDTVYGGDATASVGGLSYKTVQAALAAVTTAGSTGKTVYILPGNYDISGGITLPAGIAMRGMNTQTCTLQGLNVTADTTLITMGENTRLEDVTMRLTSAQHHTLKGIVFGATTTKTSKLRTTVLIVDNSAASSGGSSTVTGIECSGTDGYSSSSFSFNSLKGSTINVYSNGGGNKRGILVSSSNTVTTRDLNIYVPAPTNTSSTGSYVGVETADATDNIGSIQMRSTTVGTVRPTVGQTYTASDILQTNPTTIPDPTYLASPGIQIGPGTDLITKSAGDKGFSTYNYPTTLTYGLKGNLNAGAAAGYLWLGTQAVSGSFPDPAIPPILPAYFRIQQPAIICGLSIALNGGPTSTYSVTVLVQYTPSSGIITNTPFTITLTGAQVEGTFYNGSLSLNTGDKLHVKVNYTGTGNNNKAHDLTVQVDLF